MPLSQNRYLSIGVLLLGLAVAGKMLLSWVEYSDKQREKYQQKQEVDLRESIHESIVQQCHGEAEQHAATMYQEQFPQAPDSKKGWYLTPNYDTSYKNCLRVHGID